MCTITQLSGRVIFRKNSELPLPCWERRQWQFWCSLVFSKQSRNVADLFVVTVGDTGRTRLLFPEENVPLNLSMCQGPGEDIKERKGISSTF